MDYIEYVLIKCGIIVLLAFVYGILIGLGRK